MQALFSQSLLEKCLEGTPFKNIKGAPFPQCIYWLNGAPGAGKGTHTPLIRNFLGISTPPIIVSDLLHESHHKDQMDSGLLIDDEVVISRVFRKLLEEPYRQVALVDGFPRTRIQADFLIYLYRVLKSLDQKTLCIKSFFIVLYVDEKHSLERQLKRGREAAAMDSAQVRLSDTKVELAQKRYAIFKEETLAALETLKQSFPYLFIDVSSGLEESQQKVLSAIRQFRNARSG